MNSPYQKIRVSAIVCVSPVTDNGRFRLVGAQCLAPLQWTGTFIVQTFTLKRLLLDSTNPLLSFPELY